MTIRDLELEKIREKVSGANLSPFRWPLAMFRCYGDLIPQADSLHCAPGFNDRPIGLSLAGDAQQYNVSARSGLCRHTQKRSKRHCHRPHTRAVYRAVW